MWQPEDESFLRGLKIAVDQVEVMNPGVSSKLAAEKWCAEAMRLDRQRRLWRALACALAFLAGWLVMICFFQRA